MDKVIEEVLSRASKNMNFEKNSPFTEEGFSELKTEISLFINNMINESYNISKRNKGDLISKSDVQKASHNLVAETKTTFRQIVASIGAFLIGFSCSKILDMLTENQEFNSLSTIILLATGMVGSFLIGITLLKSKK